MKIKEEVLKEYGKKYPDFVRDFKRDLNIIIDLTIKKCQEQNLSLEKKPSRKKGLNPNLEEAMEVVKEFSNNKVFRKGFVKCWEYLEEKKIKQVEELKRRIFSPIFDSSIKTKDQIEKELIKVIDEIFKKREVSEP